LLNRGVVLGIASLALAISLAVSVGGLFDFPFRPGAIMFLIPMAFAIEFIAFVSPAVARGDSPGARMLDVFGVNLRSKLPMGVKVVTLMFQAYVAVCVISIVLFLRTGIHAGLVFKPPHPPRSATVAESRYEEADAAVFFGTILATCYCSFILVLVFGDEDLPPEV
jgi:hypothetical protein